MPWYQSCRRLAWFCLLLALLAQAAPAWAHPVIPAVKVHQPPVIDGALDDPCWKSASMVEGFRYLAKRQPSTEKTQAWLCYDSENCYFAFYCYDSRPQSIRANETKRNGENIWADDFVEVCLDPLHVHRRGGSFYLNPIGTQYETLTGGAAEKVEWRGDWRGAAKIVSDGWTAEFAIPFALLKYPKGQSVFGFNLSRTIAREAEDTDWPPFENDVWDSYETADWVDLQCPAPSHKPRVMGYATAEAGEEGSSLGAGLDAKQVYEPDTTIVASLNPDFKNVEDEVESIVFSYGEKYVSDRRPFFMEGEDYFPESHILYSRRIPQFDLGAKTYGRSEQLEFGVLDAWQIGDRNDSVLCGNYQADQYNLYQGAFASADFPGTHNRVGGLYHLYHRPLPQGDIYWSSMLAKSWTASPGGDGLYQRYWFTFSPNPGYVGGQVRYFSVPNEYNAVDGYVGESGYHGFEGEIVSYYKFEDRWLQSWQWELNGARFEKEGGGLYHDKIGFWVDATTTGGTDLSLGYSRDGRPPNVDRVWSPAFFWNMNVPLESGGLKVHLGKVLGGDYLYSLLFQDLRLSDALALQASAEYQRMAPPGEPVDDLFQGIFSANFDIDPERGFAGRYVNTGGKHNFYVSYRQVVRRGMDAYVIIGNPNAERTESRLAVKLVSMF